MRTTHGTALTTVVLAVLLAGCAGSTDPGADDGTPTAPEAVTDDTPEVPSVAETSFPGAPDDVTGEDTAVVAGDDDRHVQVVTFGSSTCPVLPTDVAWDDDGQVLRIELSGPDAYSGPCTMDLAPTTSVVALPDDSPDAAGLTVEVDGRSVVVD